MILFILLSIFPLVNLCISVYNYFTAGKLILTEYSDHVKLVSVLIPVRNEERNIEGLITSLITQTYAEVEILLLDDHSSDNTLQLCKKFAATDTRVKVICGKELQENWHGKNWACSQLADSSKGDYLLFIDADVRLNKNALESAVQEIEISGSDLLTIYPTQVMKTIGEKICVSVLNWVIFSLLPIAKVLESKNPKIAGAVGQFMFFKREKYFNSGGHSLVRDKIVEDIELGRILKSKGYRVNLLTGGNLVTCRMYTSFTEAVEGFTKNAYPSSRIPGTLYLLFVVFLCLSYLLPFILLSQNIKYAVLTLIILLQQSIVIKMSSGKILTGILLFPAQMIIMVFISFRSYISYKKKKLHWKGRNLQGQNII